MIWPLCPADRSYRRLLAFITLVAPPAALYAIPVERFVSLGAARSINGWFLAVVAAWRVGLLFFTWAGRRLSPLKVAVAGLLPLTAITTTLFALNLGHVTMDPWAAFAIPHRRMRLTACSSGLAPVVVRIRSRAGRLSDPDYPRPATTPSPARRRA
ncbi:MAG: hypothetical protein IPG96_13525 [Proteobacteria bacterium]|nr:hypothetical protein [Pseudomonadota bacterium]